MLRNNASGPEIGLSGRILAGLLPMYGPEALLRNIEDIAPPFWRVSKAPGAAQTPKITEFRPLKKLKFPPKVQPRTGGCDIKVLKQIKDRKSAIFGVWAGSGAPENRPKGGGRSPPPFGRVSGAPGAAPTLKMTDFRPLEYKKFPPKVQQRRGTGGCNVNTRPGFGWFWPVRGPSGRLRLGVRRH